MEDRNGKAPEPPEPTPWDRIGQYLGDMAAFGQVLANRNLTLWNDVSQSLKKDRYTADDMAEDAASILNASMENFQAAWNFWMRVPEREAVASSLPVAVLYYSRRRAAAQTTRYDASEPVWIRVPVVEGEDLPAHAKFDLMGPDVDSTEELRETLTVDLGDAGRAYKLQGGTARELVSGSYTGLIFLLTKARQIRPLASLRIIVE